MVGMGEKELLTAAEAAERLTIAKRTLLRWARENKIESVKLSRKVVLFTAEAIDDFVKGRSSKVEPAPMNHRGAGRKMTGPTSTKKGGGKKTSGELWKDLRKEVVEWQ
jgi:excisionase family DNA binding protein